MANKYKPLFELGSGAFGAAWVVQAKDKGLKLVSKNIKIAGLSSKEIDHCVTEVVVLGNCHHNNIIRYTEAFVDSGALHIIMEYATGGDLNQKIQKQAGKYFSNKVIMGWFVQVLQALDYIHNRNILHRDLKPRNVFLTADGTVKLGDFGISRILTNTQDLAQTLIGTPFYISPEICSNQPYNSCSDMWAAGCLLYELCLHRVPFMASSLSELSERIRRGRYDTLPSQFGSLIPYIISRLLVVSPDGRMSAGAILEIPDVRIYGHIHRRKKDCILKVPRSRSVHYSPAVNKLMSQPRSCSESRAKGSDFQHQELISTKASSRTAKNVTIVGESLSKVGHCISRKDEEEKLHCLDNGRHGKNQKKAGNQTEEIGVDRKRIDRKLVGNSRNRDILECGENEHSIKGDVGRVSLLKVEEQESTVLNDMADKNTEVEKFTIDGASTSAAKRLQQAGRIAERQDLRYHAEIGRPMEMPDVGYRNSMEEAKDDLPTDVDTDRLLYTVEGRKQHLQNKTKEPDDGVKMAARSVKPVDVKTDVSNDAKNVEDVEMAIGQCREALAECCDCHSKDQVLKSRTYAISTSALRRLSDVSPKLTSTVRKQRFALSISDPDSLSVKTSTPHVGGPSEDTTDQGIDDVFTPSSYPQHGPDSTVRASKSTVYSRTYTVADSNNNNHFQGNSMSQDELNSLLILALSTYHHDNVQCSQVLQKGLVQKLGVNRATKLLQQVRQLVVEEGQSYLALKSVCNVDELQLLPWAVMKCVCN